MGNRAGLGFHRIADDQFYPKIGFPAKENTRDLC
jgi:hypothetical protein